MEGKILLSYTKNLKKKQEKEKFMASDNNTDQGHSHGLQCQHMPQTSA